MCFRQQSSGSSTPIAYMLPPRRWTRSHPGRRRRERGAKPVPTSGKPSWTGDYAWDERLTGRAVVNWIREGFGLPRHDPAKYAPHK